MRNAGTRLVKRYHRVGAHILKVICIGLAMLPVLSSAAFRYFDPADTAAVPKNLSSTGIFPDGTGKTAIPEAVYFDINAALWSDGAWKQRWILLPPGRSIPYDDTTDFFDYPDSTVFIKNFWLEAREGDTASRVLWETRLLVKGADAAGESGWHGFSYRWNASGREAYLVSPTEEFDTLFRYTDAGGRRSYKRWRFPSATCKVCHKTGSGTDPSGRPVSGRAVLGFYPAQLKRPSAAAAGGSQVADFFSRGVFSGTVPDSAALARRFVGIKETVPANTAPEVRGKLLDTKARSYLAANCSGCHGYRGIALGAIGDKKVNFDYYRFSPAIPFAHFPTQTFSLNDTTTFRPSQDPYGRAAFIEAVVMAGLDTGAGRPWNMSLPPHAGDPLESLTPALLYPGYPSLTELLYRQVRRASAWTDSAVLYRYFSMTAAGGDTVSAARLAWVFKAPWGSAAWEDTLAGHGWSPDSIFALTGQFADGRYFWHRAPEQMPELASYLPDTAALNVLAAWVREYSEPVGVRPRVPGGGGAVEGGAPRISGLSLVFPGARGGTVTLSDLRGRSWKLKPEANGTFRLPEGLRPGVYILRGGSRAFRLPVF